MKNWTKKDFTIEWRWHRGRLQGQENRGWYHIYSHIGSGGEINSGFRTKHDAERWLGAWLKQANALRKEAHAKGII